MFYLHFLRTMKEIYSLFYFPSYQKLSPLFSPNSLQNCTPGPRVLHLLSFPPLSFLQILHNKAPENLTVDAGPHSQGREENELIGPTQKPL